MFTIGGLDYKLVVISLCSLYLYTLCDGRPLSKRSVSEIQFMHNFGEHKHLQERRDWLQMKLRDIHTASARSTQGEAVRTRRLLPQDLPDLEDLTPEEIEYALNFLEKVLKSRH